MDVQVVGRRMIGCAGEHAVDGAERLGGLGLGRALVGLPVVPRRGVHPPIDPDDGGVVIIRMRLGDALHRGGKRAVERGAVGFRVGRDVARGEGVDVGALADAGLGLERLRALERGPGERRGFVGHRAVDVRPVRVGLAPVRHRAVGIEFGDGAEGADRLLVVEVEEQYHALVEVALSERRRGRDGVVMAADVLEERRGRLARLGGADGSGEINRRERGERELGGTGEPRTAV